MGISDMARDWFGYGRWGAPYWFIGPEPGMADTNVDGLEQRCRAWQAAGGGELIDCKEHHRELGFDRWHRTHPATQPTWRKLIKLLLAFKGLDTSLETVREYQRTNWGTTHGETCVIELSALAARSTLVVRDRCVWLEQRVARIREHIAEVHPEFVVMYGLGSKADWKSIGGCAFDASGIGICEGTIFAITPHPNARGVGDDYWVALAKRIRESRARAC